MAETDIKKLVETLPRLHLSGRSFYDLELLLVEGFKPLNGFMNEDDYDSVVSDMRLKSGELFPIPVALDVPDSFEQKVGEQVLLCDAFSNPLAVMTIESRYAPDKKKEAELVYGTTDTKHPGVYYLMSEMHDTYIGGTLEQVALPKRHDFKEFRKTPAELKETFKEKGWDKVVGFQTRNPMHRAHFELVKRANEMTGAPVLVHPVVGMTKPGDIDYVTRVRTYNVVCNTHGKDFTHLALLPLAMRMAGPREALWHAIIRKNYGCTHFIVGRDHAGPGKDSEGKPFYEESAARELVAKHAEELGIELVQSDELVYAPTRDAYAAVHELEEGEETENISGTEFRRMLHAGEEIPEWFSFPESIDVLKSSVAKDSRPGVAFLFTGLPGAGKSTIATLLESRLHEIQDRDITMLDGDVNRQHLSKGLTFSKEDRDTNVKRVGFVAAEVVRHGGLAICAIVAPYEETRRTVRKMVEEYGVFVEVHVATPLEECERRDTKGMYAKARRGEIKEFTGVSDPYEIPTHPEFSFDTVGRSPEAIVEELIEGLTSKSLL